MPDPDRFASSGLNAVPGRLALTRADVETPDGKIENAQVVARRGEAVVKTRDGEQARMTGVASVRRAGPRVWEITDGTILWVVVHKRGRG